LALEEGGKSFVKAVLIIAFIIRDSKMALFSDLKVSHGHVFPHTTPPNLEVVAIAAENGPWGVFFVRWVDGSRSEFGSPSVFGSVAAA
jgi:hypothetical protein